MRKGFRFKDQTEGKALSVLRYNNSSSLIKPVAQVWQLWFCSALPYLGYNAQFVKIAKGTFQKSSLVTSNFSYVSKAGYDSQFTFDKIKVARSIKRFLMVGYIQYNHLIQKWVYSFSRHDNRL
ncbi:hypothetical protein Zymop_1698 [Zymomonas mobilis subsp. pomaceae ATCC 29192]|uniref:Uncharacterized protein n=1 Tax=Zymomonas mobilis subsp. pomaceae (strain ATCC 29192 / DSM 22645 / JCM 10191 / CCUG 17912 / NBRC 13757 / NCIMB 11200 / NRRL B-4491 / Barker I) TaxID=579138 RepID=F8ERX3_ZYMMT|nr:hypothetical protein Zymop_1698 [Zymomonas mobilis subsp. pomaceae ATCC 29192]